MSIDKQKTHKLLTEIDQLTIPIPDLFADQVELKGIRCNRCLGTIDNGGIHINSLCSSCINASDAARRYTRSSNNDIDCVVCEQAYARNGRNPIETLVPSTDGWDRKEYAHPACLHYAYYQLDNRYEQDMADILEWANCEEDGCRFGSCPDPYDNGGEPFSNNDFMYSGNTSARNEIIEHDLNSGEITRAWINGNEHQVSNGVIGPALHENLVRIYNDIDVELEDQYER